MKVTVKTLQHTSFPMDLDSSDTVEGVKLKMVSGGHAPEVSRIKLIHTGKILTNEKTIGDCGVKDGDHMVLMVTQSSSQVKPTENAAAKPVPEDKKKPDAAPTAAMEDTAEFKQALQSILEMGYSDRDIVAKALRVAFGNPDRAVELLESGEIFEVLEEEEEEEEEDGDNGDAGNNDDDQDRGYDENAPNPLEYLRNDPQFQQMRAILQANPQLLPHFVEELRQTNQEIFELISNNSSAFVHLMQEGLGFEGREEGGGGAGGNAARRPSPPTPANVIRVTEREKAAIERLEQLGFDKARAVEAFLACDKNEELAANFLLEHMHDEE